MHAQEKKRTLDEINARSGEKMHVQQNLCTLTNHTLQKKYVFCLTKNSSAEADKKELGRL
jgi:hypothetical protein